MRARRKYGETGFGAVFALLLALTFFLGACASPPAPGPNVTRVVLVWLKNPESRPDRARVTNAAHSLRMIPGVMKVEVVRSIPSLAPGSDQSFDLGVIITFREHGALRRYEKDPRHLETMRRYLRPTVRRYEVFNLSSR